MIFGFDFRLTIHRDAYGGLDCLARRYAAVHHDVFDDGIIFFAAIWEWVRDANREICSCAGTRVIAGNYRKPAKKWLILH